MDFYVSRRYSPRNPELKNMDQRAHMAEFADYFAGVRYRGAAKLMPHTK